MPITPLDPTTTALVLIDLQRGITSMDTAPLPAPTVVANATRLADAFRARRSPVVLVRVAVAPDGADALRPDADEPPLAPGTRPEGWSEIVPDLGPEPGDLVVTKRQWGAFYGTDLDLQLRRRGVTTIVLGGIATNFGVESTARDAYERGYRQVFVADAMAGRTAEDHEFALRRILPRIGRVATTDEALAALRAG